MKKLLLSILIVSISIGCQNDDTVFESQDQSLSQEAFLKTSNKVKADIIVFPSGDLSGVTDASNIESALNNISPNGIVLLTEGTFYVNKTIVASFNGTLTGVSTADTEIIAVGSQATPFLNGLINNIPGGFPFPVYNSALLFIDSPNNSVTVSNLSASVPDGFVAESNFFGNNDLFSFITVSVVGISDTHFDNLKLTGNNVVQLNNPVFKFQPSYGITVLGDSSEFPIMTSGGNHTVTNTEISKIGIQATVHELMRNATIEIANNTLFDVKQIITRFLDGCEVAVDNNNIDAESFGSIVITQEGVPIGGSTNTVKISRNKVYTSGFSSVEIGIANGTANFDLLIEKNKLTNEGADPIGFFNNVAGILIDAGNDGALVQDNTIRGTSNFGIIQLSNDGLFIENNLQGLTPEVSDYILVGNNNTVTDNGNSTLIDFGIGNVFNSGAASSLAGGAASSLAAGSTKKTDLESLFEKDPKLMDLIPGSNAYKVQH